MDIQALLRQPSALPVAPGVVQDLIGSFNDEHVSHDAIARKLSADPVLSAKLLRLSNSAYYHVSRRVDSVSDAVMMLGFVTVRTLVISNGLVNGFKSAPGLNLKQFWHYCLNTAVTAKWLAGQLDENTELAFTLGMTHAIGQLVIHVGMPEQAQLLDKKINPLDSHRFEMEREAFGFDYAQVSAELADHWKFPAIFSSTISAFPEPLEHEPFMPMSAIIHLSSWFARTRPLNLPVHKIRTMYPAMVSIRLGIEPAELLENMPPLSELAKGLEELIA